jgi:hypothetical protein
MYSSRFYLSNSIELHLTLFLQAVIIDAETGQLLWSLQEYLLSKYCAKCSALERAGKEHQEHDCNKNFEGPSTAMETKIIVAGFN